jgi:Secretion system C-terminal sorting domain
MKNMTFFNQSFWLMVLFASLFQPKTEAQTTLAAGDIAFSGYISVNTPDEFSFYILKNITNGTVINFTDNGWNSSTSALMTAEQTLTWTCSGSIAAGKQVHIAGTTVKIDGVTNGTVTGSALSLSTVGDQVLAYQGLASSPTFISGIHMNVYSISAGDPVNTTAAAWDGTNSNNQSASALPPGLTTGTNAIWIGTQDMASSEKDNAVYNCTGYSTTIATLRAALNDKTNWTTSIGSPAGFTLPPSCTTLPIELGYFQAHLDNNLTLLKWRTYSETNNNYFEIERSFDTRKFVSIGQIKGHGTISNPQNYTFIDENPLKGINYYRLKQVDIDGKFSYSKIESVIVSKGGKTLIYPSYTEGVVSIQTDDTPLQKVEVVNSLGQLVLSKSIRLEPFSLTQIDLTSLPIGLYHIIMKTDSNSVTEKVFKTVSQ